MKPLHPFSLLRMSLLLLFLSLAVAAQTSQFTYQGQLTDGGNPANSDYDFQFKLFDALTEGTQTGATVTRDNITVSNGIFSVTLDFGAAAFPGANRFLEIAVRPGTSTGSYTLLTPRQPVLSTPYAVRSLSAATADAATNAVNFSGTLTGDVTGTQGTTTVVKLHGQTVASTVPVAGQVMKFNGTTNQWEPAADDSSGGTLTGVTAGTGLNGGGVTGNVSLNIANSGVGTAQLADNSVTDAKLVSVSGGKVTGAVANATNATNAANAVNANNATNAANATTAVNFSGSLGGDVTGNQIATTVEKLRNVTVPAPVLADNGKVLKYKNNGVDPITYEWAADNTSVGGGVTNVTASGPLTSSGGSTPNISLAGLVPLANGGTGANLSATGGGGHYLKQTSAGGAVTVGAIPAGDLPDLSGSYIKNGTATQTGSNFNISGNGTAGGTLSGNVVNTTTHYNLGGARILTSISNNLFGGASSGVANTTGDSNTFLGTSAGAGNTSGGANVFVGVNAGNLNTIGTYNTVIGAQANLSSNNLTNATAIGAGSRVTCSDCMVLGSVSGVAGSSSTVNVGIGLTTPAHRLDVAGAINTTMQYNIGGNRILSIGNGTNENLFVGEGAGPSNPNNKSLNSFFGAFAGANIADGANQNAFFGAHAGESTTTGWGNVFTGVFAGERNTTGRENTFIGYKANTFANDPNHVNATAIGANARVACDNCMVLGGITGVDSGTSVKVGIGTTNPTERLHVAGNILATGTITPSDQRYKQNITLLSGALAKVQRLRGVSYDWKQAAYPEMQFAAGTQLGFIAQEVEQVLPEAVHTTASGMYSLNYSAVIPLLVEAVKEQQQQATEKNQQIEQLKQQNARLREQSEALKKENAAIEARLAALEKMLLQLQQPKK